MKIDNNCRILLEKLELAGYQAFYVGGCVRDTVMRREINDVDIATDAPPEQIMSVFCGYKVIPTGLKHGTPEAYTMICHGVILPLTLWLWIRTVILLILSAE